MRAVIRRIDHDRVVGDAEIVELLQQEADVVVVFHHPVGILGLRGQARRAAVLVPHMGAKMHPRRAHPNEKGLLRLHLPLYEIDRRAGRFVVDGFHPLLGQRPGVLDRSAGARLDDAARAEFLAELRVAGIGPLLGLLLGVQMIEVAEKLVEAVGGRQILVAIAEMVLTELACRIAERL